MRAVCPCLRGESFAECCEPYLTRRAQPPTAERLMRSRYTAFSVRDAEYLLHSWHSDTAPVDLDLDPAQRWYRLDIHDTVAGGLLDADGVVEFTARYRHPDGPGVLRERSRFVRENGRWVYLDGQLTN